MCSPFRSVSTLNTSYSCFPAGSADEQVGQETAYDDAAGPAGMKDVEVMGPFSWIERGGQRVDHGFAGAIPERKQKLPQDPRRLAIPIQNRGSAACATATSASPVFVTRTCS